jgi:uncharacterized protein YqgC (DUF456 family)
MKRVLKKTVILVVGWAFILLGIAGLVLPILQGILFILIGLVILSYESAWARWAVRTVRRRFPRLAESVDNAKLRAKTYWARIAGREEKG